MNALLPDTPKKVFCPSRRDHDFKGLGVSGLEVSGFKELLGLRPFGKAYSSAGPFLRAPSFGSECRMQCLVLIYGLWLWVLGLGIWGFGA